MQRFATMMLSGLAAAGVPAELIQPQPFLGRIALAGPFVAKWLGYFDKFLFFPRQLRRKLAAGFDLVHICDHSNAMYCAQVGERPVNRHLSRFTCGPRRAGRRDRMPGFCNRQISAALDRLRPAPGQRGGLRLIGHSARRGARGRPTRRSAATSAHSSRHQLSLPKTVRRSRAHLAFARRGPRSRSTFRAPRRL